MRARSDCSRCSGGWSYRGSLWPTATTLLTDLLLVRPGVHEPVDLGRVVRPDFDHPAGAVGIAVDESRLLVETVIDGGHFTRDRREQLRHRFHGLDSSEHIVLRELGADFR